MKKTVTLTSANGEPVELVLSNSIAWMMEYRDQFNRDIVPSLMPLLLSLSDLAAGLAEEGVNLEKIEMKDLAKILGSYSMTEAIVKLSALEMTDFLNIVWALNKAADDSVPEPRKWIRQFEEFPLDEIGPVAVELVVRGVISSKNWERLTEAKNSIKSAGKTKKKTTKR